MNIYEIDKNFQPPSGVPAEEIEWFNCAEEPFTLYGGMRDEKGYCRIPRDIAKTVSEGVEFLNEHTAGLRFRFKTNSPYIGLAVKWNNHGKMYHMASTGSSGFDLYSVDNGIHSFKTVLAPFELDPKEGYSTFKYLNISKNETYKEGKVTDYIMNFPLYNSVTEVYVGLKKGSVLEKGGEYTHSIPAVFYGSSITQGGCASRPGTSYEGFLSRALDMDYINLGFSGNGKGEKEIVDYMKNLKMSMFISDYDHNAPTLEHLKETHYKMYENIRTVNPDLPYVMISKPDFCNSSDWGRRETIVETYVKALANGDKNVYFVDGAGIFNGIEAGDCTVDGTHPTDLGFYKMSEAFYPVIKLILSKKD